MVLHASMPFLVILVGTLGLLHDSWGQPARPSWTNAHSLFGPLLWIFVIARFYRQARQTPSIPPIDIYSFARHLSRIVYLQLYALMLAMQLFGIFGPTWHGRTIPEDFQDYLAWGFFALLTIHLLAALVRHSSRQESASAT